MKYLSRQVSCLQDSTDFLKLLSSFSIKFGNIELAQGQQRLLEGTVLLNLGHFGLEGLFGSFLQC